MTIFCSEGWRKSKGDKRRADRVIGDVMSESAAVQRHEEFPDVKEARRKAAALQPHLAAPLAAAEETAPAAAPMVLSINAQKRRDKRGRRRQAAQRREAERQQADDEEFVKVVRQVERLKLREPADVECDAPPNLAELGSVKALGAKLQKLEKQQRQDTARAKSRPTAAGAAASAPTASRRPLGRLRDGFAGAPGGAGRN